jgi:hypothetical protein
MKKIKNNTKKKNREILENFTCEGLDQHNRSIEWLGDVLDDIDAKIETCGDQRRYDAESFSIRMYGSSGVLYRISVHYRRRQARLMVKRIKEINLDGREDDGKTMGVLMHAFDEMMTFDTHWFDARDGDWESICIHGRREKRNAWPGDTLVSLVSTLSDDLRSSLELSMNTLRRELCEAYPIAWFNNQTQKDVVFDDVEQHVVHLHRLENAEDKEDFEELRQEAFEEIGWGV